MAVSFQLSVDLWQRPDDDFDTYPKKCFPSFKGCDLLGGKAGRDLAARGLHLLIEFSFLQKTTLRFSKQQTVDTLENFKPKIEKINTHDENLFPLEMLCSLPNSPGSLV